MNRAHAQFTDGQQGGGVHGRLRWRERRDGRTLESHVKSGRTAGQVPRRPGLGCHPVRRLCDHCAEWFILAGCRAGCFACPTRPVVATAQPVLHRPLEQLVQRQRDDDGGEHEQEEERAAVERQLQGPVGTDAGQEQLDRKVDQVDRVGRVAARAHSFRQLGRHVDRAADEEQQNGQVDQQPVRAQRRVGQQSSLLQPEQADNTGQQRAPVRQRGRGQALMP
ncbi:hypothetical protein Y695_02667 [Hydrogenophaga sp. T4]|nr:hypothetical protein Y695_02667 [Hydrogenophaga sp. T4]